MPWFDRFDILEAYYLYFSHYHSGQNSREYRRLSRMTRYFKPASMLTLTHNGAMIYERLEARQR